MMPDKIFITEHNANVETGYFSRNKDDVFTQEYIRKDALIEWLESRISSSDGGLIEGLLDLAYKDTIKHLNEM